MVDPLESSSLEIEAMDAILKANVEDVPKVPEQLFVEHILPRLAARGEKVDLSFWSEIAGNPYRPIDVVNEQGVVLFRVPALLRQYDSFTRLSPSESVPERMEKARLKTQVHPQLGEVYYDQEFSKLAVVPPPSESDTKAWNSILNRYGYQPITTVEEVPETALDVAEKSLFKEGDEEFDDL